MKDEKNKGGRPPINEEQKKQMLSKLEPYLKSGLSVRKALKEAQISSATFYRIMDKDEGFREQIDRFRQFVAVLLNNSLVRELQNIIKKQNDGQPLTSEDKSFLWKFATTSNLTREEFGERKTIGLYDPEVEIQRVANLIDEATGEDDGNEINKNPA